jgi:hypothetical protein
LAESAVYDPAQNDFTAVLKTLLDLDGGAARRQALVRTLGQGVEYQPQRRQDAAALFLAANAGSARKLWPQLQFHHAGDLPIYTTSHIYAGRFDATRDIDLVGLRFPDSPWLLQSGAGAPLGRDALPAELAEERWPPLGRLFAMGMDAFGLLTALGRLEDFPGASLAGATGDLTLDGLRQVHRQLIWARMTPRGPSLPGELDTEPEPAAEAAAAQPAEPARPADAGDDQGASERAPEGAEPADTPIEPASDAPGSAAATDAQAR